MPSASPGIRDLPAAILADANGNKNRNILDLASPAAFQVNTIYGNIGIVPGKRSGTPGFDMLISLFIQVADGSRGYFRSPYSFGDILYAPDRNTGQIHLNQSFFHERFPAAVSFNNCSLERNAFEFWNLQFDFSCGSVEIAFIMAGAASLAVRGTLILFSVD